KSLIRWRRQNTGHGQPEAGRLQNHPVARHAHLETAAVRLRKIETELVGSDEPLPEHLLAHRIAPQPAVALVHLTPVHLVRELHARQFRANLRTRELSKALFRGRAAIAGEDHPQQRDEAKGAHRGMDAHFGLQAFKHIWYSVLQAGPA